MHMGDAGAENAVAGSWPSPFGAEFVAGASLRFGGVQEDGGDVYWTEGRPSEAGRSVLMRARDGGEPEEVLASDVSVRSRVHEYGGGEFTVTDGVIVYVEADSQDLYVVRNGESNRLTKLKDWRFADMALDLVRGRVIAVAEWYNGADAHDRPDNLLVSIALDNGVVTKLPGNVVVLDNGHDFFSSPRLSPDGTTLTWLAWNLPHMPWEAAELWSGTIVENGPLDNLTQLLGGDGVAVFQPQWSGDAIIAVSDRPGFGNLFRSDQSGVAELTTGTLEFFRPGWVFGMRSYTLVDDKRCLAIGYDDGALSLCAVSLADGGVTPISLPDDVASLDAPVWCAKRNSLVALVSFHRAPAQLALLEIDWAAGTVASINALRDTATDVAIDAAFVSAGSPLSFSGDGDAEVFGVHYPPTSGSHTLKDGELPPAIVRVHGGPTGMAGRGLDWKTQFWTSRGFAVFEVDYSGSAGYGRAYRDRLNGEWGLRDTRDCVKAAEMLAERGLAHKNHIAISGGSSGGYTVLMASAMSDVFSAGGCYYGISDLGLLLAHTHKFEAGYIFGLTGTSEDNWEETLKARSPITMTEDMTMPTIVFQGMKDKVVPPEQSEEIVAALNARGVPVAYHSFANEGHGFRQADAIIASLNAEHAFYQEHFQLV